MAFWAVELHPGKEHTTTPDFDLIVSQAVLPESAKDKSRTIISVKTEELESPFAVASLTLGSIESVQMNVFLDQGVECTFINHGKNPVHLVGRYHEDYPEGMMGEDDEEFGSEGEEGFSGSEEDGEDDIDEEELAKEIELAGKKRAAAAAANGGGKQQPAKKQKGEQGAAVPAPSPAGAKGAAHAKPQANSPAQQKGGKPAAQQQQQKGNKVIQLPGGMAYEVLKNGSGPIATRGKRVKVKYVGKFTNGRVFETSSKPFAFKLGGGEVIRGWDLGVEGMAVGEKRKLIIPPELAYGKRGAPPDIPPNTTLHFDVEFLG